MVVANSASPNDTRPRECRPGTPCAHGAQTAAATKNPRAVSRAGVGLQREPGSDPDSYLISCTYGTFFSVHLCVLRSYVELLKHFQFSSSM